MIIPKLRMAFEAVPVRIRRLPISGRVTGDVLDLDIYIAPSDEWQTRVRLDDGPLPVGVAIQEDPQGRYLPIGDPTLAELRQAVLAACEEHIEELYAEASEAESSIDPGRAVHQWDIHPNGTVHYGGWLT